MFARVSAAFIVRGFTYDRAQEQGKVEFKPELLSAPLRSLFYSFNSAPFLLFLENLTAIKSLIPDPYFLGAGLHEVANRGHLDIHADFNHITPSSTWSGASMC